MAQPVKNLPAMQETQETWVQSLSWGDPLEKEMATHSSIIAWKIPWKRILVGYSPWGYKEADTTERLTLSKLGWLLMVDVRCTMVNVWKVLVIVLTQIWLNKWLFLPLFFFSPSSMSLHFSSSSIFWEDCIHHDLASPLIL